MVKYVPILKWKAGEKNALKHLDQNQLGSILPIVELVDPIDESILINEIKESTFHSAFIDNLSSEETDFQFYKNIVTSGEKSGLYLIPIFYIDDLFNNDLAYKYDEIGIRLQVPEPINSLSYNDFFTKIFKNINSKIDIILDLTFVEDVQVATLKNVGLKETLNQLKNYYSKINKLIISSTSFPENLNDLEAGEEKKYIRYELSIFDKIVNNKEYSNLIDKLIYSDYGVNKFTDSDIDFSKLQYGVLPKIKYTTNDFYYVQKGKKDRLHNIYSVSVFDMCSKITNSGFYYGKDFSYGDEEIYTKAIQKEGPGGNKDWVTISTVHHIAAILKQLSN